MNKGLVAAFLVAIALITYTDLKDHQAEFTDSAGNDRGLPIPSPRRYFDALFIYGALGLVAAAAPTFAAAIGWGLLVPIALGIGAGTTDTQKAGS